MNARSAVVIVVDRVGAGYLGPFGNTWIDTPAFNRLASQSLICEQAFATEPTLTGAYREYETRLLNQIAATGLITTLLTDEADLIDTPFAHAFLEKMGLEKGSGVFDRNGPEGASHQRLLTPFPNTADTPDQTQMAHSFAAAIDWLEQSREPFLLWLHVRGMAGAWDAPREFRTQFADEDDPPPPIFVEPPNRKLELEADPDELLGIGQAYAGQIVLLDLCLEMLLDVLDEHSLSADTLLVFTSPRGFPIGEHGGIGPAGDSLHEETVHVPLLMRTPDRHRAMEREQRMIRPADIAATLAEWFGLERSAESRDAKSLLLAEAATESPPRELVSVFGAERSVRTSAWLLRQTAEQKLLLYAKPDDRWESNEVADRCGELAEELAVKLKPLG